MSRVLAAARLEKGKKANSLSPPSDERHRIGASKVYTIPSLNLEKESIQMTVKQLYEILGKYIDVGAGDWAVKFRQTRQFKTRKEHREWLKTKAPDESSLFFDVGEILPVYVISVEDGIEEEEYKCALLYSPVLIKDEGRAFYHLPSKDFVDGKRDVPFPKKLELVAKTSKGSKKDTKKSAKTTKGSKKK